MSIIAYAFSFAWNPCVLALYIHIPPVLPGHSKSFPGPPLLTVPVPPHDTFLSTPSLTCQPPLHRAVYEHAFPSVGLSALQQQGLGMSYWAHSLNIHLAIIYGWVPVLC